MVSWSGELGVQAMVVLSTASLSRSQRPRESSPLDRVTLLRTDHPAAKSFSQETRLAAASKYRFARSELSAPGILHGLIEGVRWAATGRTGITTDSSEAAERGLVQTAAR